MTVALGSLSFDIGRKNEHCLLMGNVRFAVKFILCL